MSKKGLTVEKGKDKTKQFSSASKTKTFYVNQKNILLDFSKCTVKSHPHDNKDFSEIIETLKAFQSDELLVKRNKHKLIKKDLGKNSERILEFINKHTNVYSIDVYHRNSKKGNIRLLYTSDYNDIRTAYILDCFIDTH